MNFARYKGAEKLGECEFVPGKVYWADNRISGDAYDSETFIIEDECGGQRTIKEPSLEWEFLSEVYAVVLNEFDGFEPGQVVVLDNIEDEGSLKVSVKGFGLREPSDVAVLDRTTLYPGLIVMDGFTGIWSRVERTDEAMWIAMGNGDLRSPQEFRFATSDGEILSAPMLICVKSEGVDEHLTKGKYYTPLCSILSDGVVIGYDIKDDMGELISYTEWRFRMV